MLEKKRDMVIDLLKSFAIIFIVLYHLGNGYLPYGYLGVEIFFVISGMFLMRSIVTSFDNNDFKLFNSIKKRVTRLFPLVLLVSTISLLIGLFVMLPDDYENLAESVIATIFFANNILADITTKNYWDVQNCVKPLMHTWYLGVLVQATIFMLIIAFIIYKLSKNRVRDLSIVTVFLTIISFILYCLPIIPNHIKFYEFPFRLFEITLGCCVYLLIYKFSDLKVNKVYCYVINVLLLGLTFFMIFYNKNLWRDELRLVLVVLSTGFILFNNNYVEKKDIAILKPIAYVGKISYSIYIVHQVIIAFMYYFVVSEITPLICFIYFIITTLISIFVYEIFENRLTSLLVKNTKINIAFTLVLLLINSIWGFTIYAKAGVVRDVPELDIYTTNVHRGMHAEYCDIPYSWNNDFITNDKTKVLVIGNSFGRDWANILNESNIHELIEISYVPPINEETINKYDQRMIEADFIFIALGPGYHLIDNSISTHLIELNCMDKLYVVGNKNFGISNGIIYANRHKNDYYDQTIEIDKDLFDSINECKNVYGDKFINLMSYVMVDEKNVKVFTDDNKFISQDCRHLTKGGAQYFSRIMDLSFIIK